MKNSPLAPLPQMGQRIDAGHAGLAQLDAALNAQIGLLLTIQHPKSSLAATDIMNTLMEHVGKLLALIEATEVRTDIINQIRLNLPGVVQRHYESRSTTAGGLFVPPTAGGRPN